MNKEKELERLNIKLGDPIQISRNRIFPKKKYYISSKDEILINELKTEVDGLY